MKEQKPKHNFRIRLEARLKNDILVNAREQLGLSQNEIAAAAGISGALYGAIERMQSYPSEDIQRKIMEFYNEYNILIDSEKAFPRELKEAKFGKKYVVTQEIPPERLLPLSTLDKKLLMPVEIEDKDMRNEDLKSAVEIALRTLPGLKSAVQYEDVLRMHFGLAPYDKEYNDMEIAQKYNISRTRVGQIKAKAIRKLRHRSSAKQLRSFLGDERINS